MCALPALTSVGAFSLYLVKPINNAMTDNDLKIILNASNDNLVRWVKRWKSIEPDTATFSAIVLEQAGEWDKISKSVAKSIKSKLFKNMMELTGKKPVIEVSVMFNK